MKFFCPKQDKKEIVPSPPLIYLFNCLHQYRCEGFYLILCIISQYNSIFLLRLLHLQHWELSGLAPFPRTGSPPSTAWSTRWWTQGPVSRAQSGGKKSTLPQRPHPCVHIIFVVHSSAQGMALGPGLGLVPWLAVSSVAHGSPCLLQAVTTLESKVPLTWQHPEFTPCLSLSTAGEHDADELRCPHLGEPSGIRKLKNCNTTTEFRQPSEDISSYATIVPTIHFEKKLNLPTHAFSECLRDQGLRLHSSFIFFFVISRFILCLGSSQRRVLNRQKANILEDLSGPLGQNDILLVFFE